MSSRDQTSRKPIRACSHYGSTTSLRSLETGSTSLKSLDIINTGNMINILDGTELSGSMRKRSPSLPPIYSKENHQAYLSQVIVKKSIYSLQFYYFSFFFYLYPLRRKPRHSLGRQID